MDRRYLRSERRGELESAYYSEDNGNAMLKIQMKVH